MLAITSNTCVNTPTTANTAGSECYIRVTVEDAAGNAIVGSAAPITVTYYKTGTTTLCSAAGGTTSGGPYANPGPVAATESATSSSLKVYVADAVAQTCDATATSGGLTSATAQVSFTGFGAATQLTATATPNPIPANGVSTSTVTVCVKDSAGNKVTSGSASTDSIALTKTPGGTSTTLITSSPQTATAGCANFTVQSTTTSGTDTYTASDASRTLSGAGGTATPTVNIIVTP
jgi:adhesin/invasin